MSNKEDQAYSNGEDKGQKVLIFRPYPFQVGQKIFIESGPRRGDWEVLALGNQKVKLRCPVSHREVDWDFFCYFVEERNDVWPHPDSLKNPLRLTEGLMPALNRNGDGGVKYPNGKRLPNKE